MVETGAKSHHTHTHKHTIKLQCFLPSFLQGGYLNALPEQELKNHDKKRFQFRLAHDTGEEMLARFFFSSLPTITNSPILKNKKVGSALIFKKKFNWVFFSPAKQLN